MARKRKDYYRSVDDDDRSLYHHHVDRNEIMRLTKMAKAWEFTCSFCFKKFPSAQAMGGHQNAHRHERMEEKRLYVRDPIGYRKRAYIKAMRESADEQSSTVDRGGSNLHAAKYEFVNINGPPEILQSRFDDVFEFNDSNNNNSNNNNKNKNNNNKNSYFSRFVVNVMSFVPPKELSLVESVGVCGGDDGEGNKGCMEFNGMDLDQKVDLTLKL